MSDSIIARTISAVAGFINRRPLAAFFLWGVLCSFQYWAFGELSFVRVFDNADATLASKLGLAESIRQYGFTWWWMNAMAGADSVGLAVISSVDTLLFIAFPWWLAYGALMFLQRFAAGYFTYLLLRKGFSLRVWPAAFAGMAYALFSQNWLNSSWSGFTTYDGLLLAAFPLVMLVLRYAASTRGIKRYAVAAALGVGVAWSSYLVFSFFLVPVALYWIAAVSNIRIRDIWLPVIVFGAFWVLASIPTQIPLLVNAPLSHRADWLVDANWHGWGVQLRKVWLYISDNMYSIAVIAAGLAAGAWRRKTLRRILYLIPAIILIWVTKELYAEFLAEHGGFLSGVQFDRFYLALPFLTLAAAAMALDYLFEQREALKSRSHILGMLPAATVAVAFGALALVYISGLKSTVQQMVSGSNYAAIFRHPAMLELETRMEGNAPARVGVVTTRNNVVKTQDGYGTFAYNPSYAWAHGMETAGGYSLLYPQRYQDYWAQVLAPRYPATGPDYFRFHSWGSKAYLYFPGDSIPTLGAPVGFAERFDFELLSLINVRYIASNFRLTDSALVLLHDGDAQAAAWTETAFSLTRVKNHFSGNVLHLPLYVYENPHAFPRVFVANAVVPVESKELLMSVLDDASLEDLRQNVYVLAGEGPDDWRGADSVAAGTVRLVNFTPDHLEIETNRTAPGVLVVSSTFSPYWKAWIDGTEAEVFPAYYALQGVALPAGRHKVELRYEPPYAWQHAGRMRGIGAIFLHYRVEIPGIELLYSRNHRTGYS